MTARRCRTRSGARDTIEWPRCGQRPATWPRRREPLRHSQSIRPCSVHECTHPRLARGLCNKHWLRWRRHGDPLLGNPDHLPTIPERFFQKIWFPPCEDDCWLWTGSRDPAGYGRLYSRGRILRAHRLSYEIHVGPIPTGLVIDHLCRNTSCVNPTHLEPVTNYVNVVVRGVTSAAAVNRRKTHCSNDHPYSPENTYTSGGVRYCHICRKVWQRKADVNYREKKRARREMLAL